VAEGFRPVRAVRAYEAIVEQIEEALARGTLRPGSRLPSERDLMTQFAVSRSTVREALRVLESSGLIRSRPGDPHGAEVLPFSAVTLRKSMHRLATVDEVSLRELIQFRMIIESAAYMLAARLRTSADIADMAAQLARMREAIAEGHEAFSEADVVFHEIVARVSGNKLLQVCGDVVRDVVLGLIDDKLVKAPDRADLMRQSLAHHTEVFEAVRAGDGAAASRLARGTLLAYYASYLSEDERPMAEALIDPVPADIGPIDT
jgi:GntR family transcriptional regulator, transcriptional repressor for pyruvate dehydrogenase complex